MNDFNSKALNHMIEDVLEGLESGRVTPEAAFETIQMAAVGKKTPEAMYHLSYFYFEGIGCEADPKKAFELLVSSAKGGFPEAQQDLHLDEDDAGDLEKGSPIYWVAVENELLNVPNRERYANYDKRNQGCSLENPFIISETDNFVHLEYEVLDIALFDNPFRLTMDRLKCQELVEKDGRFYDVFTIGVTDIEEEVDELYYFDITAGFKARSNNETPSSTTLS